MTAYIVSAGVTSSGITLNTGDTEAVLSGGTSVGTAIRGGTETVSSGGRDSGTTISSGLETVVAGGTASDVTILGGPIGAPFDPTPITTSEPSLTYAIRAPSGDHTGPLF